MKYFDAHTHVQFATFKDDWKEVIQKALKNDVWVVNVGTQLATSQKAIEVAHEFPDLPAEAGKPAKAGGVFATVGLHPIHTAKSYHDAQELGDAEDAKGFTSRGEEFDPEVYKKLAMDPKVVAIGECGLDYYRLEEESKARQAAAFVGQMEVAQAVKKPLMIHCRQAFADLIKILKEHKHKLLADSPGVIHFFSGTPADAKVLLDLGFAFTFGGVITFTRDYDEVIKLIPNDRILSETDAPYVTPAPYRGKRNEPSYVIEVVKKLAELKGLPAEEMRDAIFENAHGILKV